jgi:hypothetical protein
VTCVPTFGTVCVAHLSGAKSHIHRERELPNERLPGH